MYSRFYLARANWHTVCNFLQKHARFQNNFPLTSLIDELKFNIEFSDKSINHKIYLLDCQYSLCMVNGVHPN